MTPAEAQVLLSMAAAFDNRKPDPDAAKAWAAALDGLPFNDCRIAVIDHYRNSSEWLMPAVIRATVRRVRRDRRRAHLRDHGPLLPPPGLTDAEERVWERDALNRISNGEVVDCDAAYGELVPGAVVNFRGLLPTPDTDSAPTGATEKEQAHG